MNRFARGMLWGLGLCVCACPEGRGQSRAVRTQPTITGVVPMAVTAGGKVKLRVLGLNLATARELVFPGTGLEPVPLTGRKPAEIPKGLEMREVGDLQFEAEVVVPAGVAWGLLPVAVQCDTARSKAVVVPVRGVSDAEQEREPNNAFTEANTLVEGRPVQGVVQVEKDVDVYGFQAKGGDRFEVLLCAGARASLLDGLVSVFDEERRMLGSANATLGSDSSVTFTVGRSGLHYVVVSDAADRGGAWCAYELLLKRVP